MLGFGALGEFPLADFGTAPPPVSVSLPTVTLLIDALASTLRAGKNFNGSTVAILLDVPTPTIGFGKSFDAPLVALSLGALTPSVQTGKNFNAPSVALPIATPVPTLRVGKNFDGPTIALALDAPIPAALTGKNFDAPPVTLVLAIPAVMASFGKNIDLPSVLLDLLAFMPDIQTGRIFNLANTFTVVIDALGALGEGALAEFALSDGESIAATYTRPIRIRMDLLDPAALPGKNFGTPPIAISLTTPVIEVDARGRPIRINAIAS